MLDKRDVILIRAKMGKLSYDFVDLAKVIKANPKVLKMVVDYGLSNPSIEKRVIRWLRV